MASGLWEAASLNSRLQVKEFALGHGVESGDLWKLNIEYGELQTNGTVDESKNSGNIAKQTLTVDGLSQPFVQTYQYDSLYRLAEARETNNGNQTWKQVFGYNRYGNRTLHQKWIGTTQQTLTSVEHPAIDNTTNRFSSGQGYTFDANGNVVVDAEGRQFTFNGDNKQTEVKDASNTVIGTYYYDGEGKRIKKVAGDETTIFVYSGGKLIAEYSTVTPPQNPTTSYTITDQLGSPRVIVDALGQVVSRRDFLPFGEEIVPDGTYRTSAQKYGQTDQVRQKFTGYQKDEETGLDFAEARMYQNLYGRFTAVDPLLASGKSADPQTFNRYVYVMNQPLTLTDSTGLQAGGEAEDIVHRVDTWITKAGEYIRQTFSFGGKSVTVRERNPVPQGFVPTDIFTDPEGIEAARYRSQNVILDSISPTSGSKTIYPWGTPEQTEQAAKTLGTIDLTGTFDLAWTSYRHNNGQASNAELAGSYAMFGSNFVGLGTGGKGGKVAVYLSKIGDDVQYAGITNNFARRAGEQLRKNGINIEPLIENLNRSDGRAVEEALIVIHKLGKDGGTLINKIHSISPKRPEYAEQLQKGYELLQTIGYK